MATLRYIFTMDDRIPASQLTVFKRGAIVNGAQAFVSTITVHEGHDFEVGHKFLYALTRTNIRTDRIFTITAKTATTITFSGLAMSFTDKNYLIPLGAETGGILLADGTYSRLNWDGSTVVCSKDPHADSAFQSATIPVEPGGEVGFWADTADVWCIARATSGSPLRAYIINQVDGAAIVTNITNVINDIQSTQPPSAIQDLLQSAVGWYRSDSIIGAHLAGGVISDSALVNTWLDSSGNDNHLTAHGSFGNGTVDTGSRPSYRIAGVGTSGNAYLPLIDLRGTTAGGGGFGHGGYFTIDTGVFSLTQANGWTVLMAMRDYLDFPQNSHFLSANTVTGGDARIDDDLYCSMGAGAGTAQWKINIFASPVVCSPTFAHTDGGDTEIIAVRSLASTSALECWVDGVRQANAGGARTADFVIREIGRLYNGAGSNAFTFGKGLFELAIFARSLTDAEIETGNSYLLERVGTGTAALLSSGIPRNIGTWPNATATSGTDSACSNGTAYVGSIFVPANMRVTGIQYLVGSVGGTDSVIASLHTASGAVVANSNLAGTTVGTAAQTQQVPFAAVASIAGPAWYFIALTFNGNTARFRTVPAFCHSGNGVIGNGVAQTFGTAASFMAPTTFTADKVPVASVY